MSSYSYEQLKVMTVAQLREIAKGIQHDALEGYSVWHKEQLLPTLCKVLGIPTHHAAQGMEKTRIKMLIRQFKTQRDGLKDKTTPQAATLRHQIHLLKHELRKMAELPQPAASAPAEPAKG